MPSVATWSHNPGVVGVPTPCAQDAAICTCAGVRVSEIARISASPAWNAVDPNVGGGADRNWLAEGRNQGGTAARDPPATHRRVASLDPNPPPHPPHPRAGWPAPRGWPRPPATPDSSNLPERARCCATRPWVRRAPQGPRPAGRRKWSRRVPLPPATCRVRESNQVASIASERAGTADGPAISVRGGVRWRRQSEGERPRECEAIEEAPNYPTVPPSARRG